MDGNNCFFFLESELEKKSQKSLSCMVQNLLELFLKFHTFLLCLRVWDHRDVINWSFETVEK